MYANGLAVFLRTRDQRRPRASKQKAKYAQDPDRRDRLQPWASLANAAHFSANSISRKKKLLRRWQEPFSCSSPPAVFFPRPPAKSEISRDNGGAGGSVAPEIFPLGHRERSVSFKR